MHAGRIANWAKKKRRRGGGILEQLQVGLICWQRQLKNWQKGKQGYDTLLHWGYEKLLTVFLWIKFLEWSFLCSNIKYPIKEMFHWNLHGVPIDPFNVFCISRRFWHLRCKPATPDNTQLLKDKNKLPELSYNVKPSSNMFCSNCPFSLNPFLLSLSSLYWKILMYYLYYFCGTKRIIFSINAQAHCTLWSKSSTGALCGYPH